MLVFVEQFKLNKSPKSKESYWTFWVRTLNPTTGAYISTGGWRYWPSKKTVGTPSVDKGSGHYSNTTKLDTDTYNLILAKVQHELGAQS